MNKTIKWIIFFAIATLCNAILIVLYFVAFQFMFHLMKVDTAEPSIQRIAYMITLIGSIIGSFATYNFILKKVSQKWDLEKILGRSIFSRKR